MTFKQDLDKAYKVKVIEVLEKSVRAVALVVDTTLVNTTPVDTGRARSNWMPSLNVPNVRIVEPGDITSVDTVFSKYKIGDTILITNSLPYIKFLNAGSSRKAPAGFVEDALAIGKRSVSK